MCSFKLVQNNKKYGKYNYKSIINRMRLIKIEEKTKSNTKK